MSTPVVDLGLAGFEPLGRLEYDRDLRAFAADPGHGDPDADQRRHDRDEPDQGEPRLLLGRLFGRQISKERNAEMSASMSQRLRRRFGKLQWPSLFGNF
jgi:hypothetical protein